MLVGGWGNTLESAAGEVVRARGRGAGGRGGGEQSSLPSYYYCSCTVASLVAVVVATDAPPFVTHYLARALFPFSGIFSIFIIALGVLGKLGHAEIPL